MAEPTDPPVDVPPSNADRLVVQSTSFNPADNPDLKVIRSVVLRDSPWVRKEASYVQVTDRHTGEYHYETLVLKTTKKLKAGEVEDPRAEERGQKARPGNRGQGAGRADERWGTHQS